MSPALETRSPRLERRVDDLLRRVERHEPLSVDDLEGLAEGSFRLGVHPDTDSAAAFEHLHRAHRLDGTNPKHAYHLGRLYLAHGQLDQAAHWLATALRLSPTSHRVWALLSVVQRALNEHYRGNTGFEPDALRKRADRIAEDVKAGEDRLDPALADVMPPPSRASLEEEKARSKGPRPRISVDGDEAPEATPAPAPVVSDVPRLSDPGVCRWSGIHDLAIEARYRLETSPRTRDQLLPEVEHVAGLAASRNGGAAAFVVLAVEWLVCGYPVATVRRLREQLPQADDPRLESLDRACDLMEAGEGELPGMLAESLERGALPATLVGLIHERRLLWRPMALADRGAHRAAQAFVADERGRAGLEEDELGARAREHVRALGTALRVFNPKPPQPMREPEASAKPAELGAAEAGKRLTSLEHMADVLSELRGGLLDFVRNGLLPAATSLDGDEAFSQLRADYRCAQGVLDGVKRSAEDAVADAGKVWDGIARLSSEKLGGDFNVRLDTVRKALAALTGLGNIAKLLRRVDQQLGAARDRYTAGEREPSSAASVLVAALEKVRPGATWQGDFEPAEAEGSFEAVEAAIARVDRAVDERFGAARATFEPYGRAGIGSAPIRELRDLVRARQADALYRLGRREDAQRIWYEMLAADRLNLAVLKNLAVSHTHGNEIAQATSAWQAYLEALCFLDVAAGTPRPHAQERADTHSICAAAYGPRSLSADLKKQDVDLSDVPGFLASAGRVEAFSANRRLAALNTAMAFRSPTLVLGLSRSIGEEALAAGRERQLALVDAACGWLPERIREPFRELCARHVEEAHAVSQDVKRRTLRRERHYKDEEELHISMLKETVILKLRVRNAVTDDTTWAVGEHSGDVIGNLRHIDAIALDPEDDLVERTLQSFGVTDTDGFLEQLNDLTDLASQVALKRIFDPEEGEPAEQPPERFARIAASWARNDIPEAYLAVLDDPQRLYPPSVAQAFELSPEETGAAAVLEHAVAELEAWSKRFPGASGPARLRATLLMRMGRAAEAREVLERARSEAFHPGAAELFAPILITASIAEGAFTEARRSLRELMETRPGDEDDLALLRNTYIGWLSAEGQTAPSVADVEEDFDRWLAGAEAGGVGDDVRANALAAKREIVVGAAAASCRDANGQLDPDRLDRALEAVVAADPGNLDALHMQMNTAFRVCGQISQELSRFDRLEPGQRAQLRSELERRVGRAEELATKLAAASEEGDQKHADALAVLEQVRQARGG